MADSVSVIIPTYNEKDNVRPLVERLERALAGHPHEIVFVDDNSRDGTAATAESLAGQYPVRVIVRTNDRGLGSAVVHGFKNTTSNVICVMDADLQHPPEVVADLLKSVQNGADLAIGSRYVKGGGCEGWSLTRRIISKGAISLAHLLLPRTRGVSDPMSGFFMLKRPVVEGADLQVTGYKILLEILIAGHSEQVAEVPFVFVARERGESKLSSRTQVQYLKHLFSLMKRTGELWRFVKFLAVGASGVVVNVGVLWLQTRQVALRSGSQLSGPSAIAIECAILSNFTLNDLFTFRDRRTKGWRSFVIRLLKFNAVSIPGAAINIGILVLLTSVFGTDFYMLFNLCGIAVAMLWNYLMNTWWTWK